MISREECVKLAEMQMMTLKSLTENISALEDVIGTETGFLENEIEEMTEIIARTLNVELTIQVIELIELYREGKVGYPATKGLTTARDFIEEITKDEE